MTSKKYCLHLEFDTPREALEWFDGLRRSDALPAEAELYVPDAIDRQKHGLTARDLIVRPAGDRPHGRVRDEVRR
ncbi:hypothetical protein [Streptomyces sp. MP131-18]|uniref:hypothetical protein n=1 Tax=Streptomyces sp. MP131-18 TaxID=1857892 RepID=UPI00097C5E32|nr:hypothetical protein [Streptomyces sp. MP131-18]ONK13254.1 hypothetical protein STBA_40170 [Streptomyces sp. MP131-18]